MSEREYTMRKFRVVLVVLFSIISVLVRARVADTGTCSDSTDMIRDMSAEQHLYDLTGSPAPVTIPDIQNPVAYYPMNGNANDESGNGNHGTVNGAVLTTDRFGEENCAYSLDGIDDYIRIDHSFSLAFDSHLNSLSVFMWIKSSDPGFSRIIEKWDESLSTPYPFSIRASSDSCWCDVYDKTAIRNINFGNIWDGGWHHIGLVVNHAENIILTYIDGIQIENKSIETVQSTFNTVPVYIGDAAGFGLRNYKGLIDDIVMYNRALSGQEISELYEAIAPVCISNYYGFTKITSGDIVQDACASMGCAWGDCNGDGYDDLFVANDLGDNNNLYINNGDGMFESVTTGPVVTDGGHSFAGSWADYDNDGDLDLYVVNTDGVNFLYNNSGQGTFIRMTAGAPAGDTDMSRGCAWVDYNMDGWLDLFVANGDGGNNRLYSGNGDGTFTSVTEGPVVNDGGNSMSGSWADYDNDGDPDLFVSNSGGECNFLYANQGDGTFERVMEGSIADDGGESWGAGWADYDNDLDLDLFVANNGGRDFMYDNNGNGSFSLIRSGCLVTGEYACRSASWTDVDNDGFVDLFTSNRKENGHLFVNGGDGSFEQYATEAANSRGCGWSDYNRDGQPDLFVCVDGGINLLYANTMPNENTWLQIQCVGAVSNRSAIGTRIRVKTWLHDTPVWQMKEISSQTGFGSQNSLMAFFGLDEDSEVDSIEVIWPSGIEWDTAGVASNQRLRIVEKLPNRSPVAVNDTLSVVAQTGAVMLYILENDFDPDGNHLQIDGLITSGTSGTAVIASGDTSVSFSPKSDFSGDDQFFYIVSDGIGGLDTGLVIIQVENPTDVTNGHMSPHIFALYQNYPNPFNPTTTIPFCVDKTGMVTIFVFNGLGQAVLDLYHQYTEPGFHHIAFNASGLSSGTYYYQIRSENKTAMKKLQIIK